MGSKFITIEGGDGAGKSTLISHLEKYLQSQGAKYVLTREPGGTPVSEEIREILLKPGRTMEPLAELFLYLAARTQHIEEFIKPNLRNNNHVICDRFSHSTMAYQGIGRNLGLTMVKELNNLSCQGLKPDLVLWIRVSPETARKRRIQRGNMSRLDAEQEDFHLRIFRGFEELAQDPNNRFVVLDGEKTPDSMVEDLLAHPLWQETFSPKKKSLLSWK